MRYQSLYQHKKLIFIIVIIMSINGLYICHAASYEKNLPTQEQVTKVAGMNFSSEYEDDLMVMTLPIDADTDDESFNKLEYKLDSFIKNTGNSINISGVDSIDANELLNGQVLLRINYKIEILDSCKDILQVKLGEYDLGRILFRRDLNKQEPFWRICNSNGSWGLGSDIITPDIIYQLIPRKIKVLYGYNTISSYEKGIITGFISIKVIESDQYKNTTISLDDLNLEPKMKDEIMANIVDLSSLEIMTNYNFKIPIYWSKIINTKESETEVITMQVKLPMRFYSSVVAK